MKYKKKTTKIAYEDGISAHDLHRQMAEYKVDMKRRCLFLYDLMSEKMDFLEDPTELEIKHLKEIKESLK